MNIIIIVALLIAVASLMLFSAAPVYAEASTLSSGEPWLKDSFKDANAGIPHTEEKQYEPYHNKDYVSYDEFWMHMKRLFERLSQVEDRIEDILCDMDSTQFRKEEIEDRIALLESQNAVDPDLVREALVTIEKELQKTNDDFSLTKTDVSRFSDMQDNSRRNSMPLFSAGRFQYLGPLARSEIEYSLTEGLSLASALDDLYLQTKGFFYYKNREYSEQINLELHMLEANVYVRQFPELTIAARDAVKKWVLYGHSVKEPCDTPFGTTEDIITASALWG